MRVADARHRSLARLDVDSRADAHFDQALDFERDQRLAHRRPRHAELLREVALGRQPRARREFAARISVRIWSAICR